MIEYEIRPQNKFTLGYKEIFQYRELIYYFTWRDVKIKYKQTALGFIWVLLQPILMALIFTYFLGNVIAEKSGLEIPYLAFSFSGFLIWGLFSAGLTNASNSLVNNANIIKKIYFPRLILPITAILSSLVDFFITLLFFLVVLSFYSVSVSWTHFLLIPLAILLTILAALGIGMFFSALNVKYRDVRYILPFFIQGMLFVSPVMFPVSITSNSIAQRFLQFNPIAGALELLRSLFTDYHCNWETVGYSSITGITLFVFGLFYFRKTESYFADLA